MERELMASQSYKTVESIRSIFKKNYEKGAAECKISNRC
jgi:hypothetical protein